MFHCLLQVTIGSEDLKANHMIQQIFEFPQEFEKYNLLVRTIEVFDCCTHASGDRPCWSLSFPSDGPYRPPCLHCGTDAVTHVTLARPTQHLWHLHG